MSDKTNTNCRWVPASDLGRELRFGDVVRAPDLFGDRLLVVTCRHKDGMFSIQAEDTRHFWGNANPARLIVRQPLSESTDEAFRREIEAKIAVAKAAQSRVTTNSLIGYYEGMVEAFSLVLAELPTPTEAEDDE